MYQNNPYSNPPPRRTATEASLRRRIFFINVIFILATVIACLWFLIACRVETIVIEGIDEITEVDVLDAVNIKKGKHLFAISEEKVEEAVRGISPYADSATVSRKLPDTVVITVQEHTPLYHVEHEGIYYLLSEELIILETSLDGVFAKSKAPCRLELPTVVPGEIGTKLLLLDKTEQARIDGLLAEFSSSTLTESFTSLDLKESYGITAVISNQYTAYFGSADGLSEKLVLCRKAVRYLTDHMNRVAGILYAEDPNEVSFVMTGVVS